MMEQAGIVLITPALADANNGNWQTARRWARMLSQAYPVRLAAAWQVEPASLMIALHARRSAESIARWRTAHPAAPLVVVLTGTDLYRDIATDSQAQRSLELADRLIVLPGGQVWFVEVKTETGRLSKLQEVFRSEINALGGNYICVYGAKEVDQWLHSL